MKNFLGNLEITVTGQTVLGEKEFIETHDLQHIVSGSMTVTLANGQSVELKIEAVDSHQWETEELEEELV